MNVRFFAPCVLRVTAPAPGLRLFMRLLSRPRFRPSRGRAGVSLGLDGCEVRLCPPCVRVCAFVSRVSEITHRHTFTFTQASHTPRGGSRTATGAC